MNSMRPLMSEISTSLGDSTPKILKNNVISSTIRSLPSVESMTRAIIERARYRLAVTGFDLIILIFMILLLTGSVFALGGSIRLFQATVLLPLSIMLTAIFFRAWLNPAGWRLEAKKLLRDWVPFLLIVFIYENMHDVAGQVMDFDIAGHLYRWDELIFGVEPTLWAQSIFSPLFTDYMAFAYALYFFLPLFIMLMLSVWNMRRDFRHMALCLTVTFLLGFAGYVLLPCSPPRYFIEHLYTDPVRLYGFFLYDRLQGAWDGLSVVSGGAFPSLHVGISAVALIYAFKFRRRNKTLGFIFCAYVPLVLSLWFSVIYLRHHWALDILGGWICAAFAYASAEVMTGIGDSLRSRYGLPS